MKKLSALPQNQTVMFSFIPNRISINMFKRSPFSDFSHALYAYRKIKMNADYFKVFQFNQGIKPKTNLHQ